VPRIIISITDGTAAISMTVQVVALIAEASLIAPAAMPPMIPPTSKSVESMALISAPVPAINATQPVKSNSFFDRNKLTSTVNVEWQPIKECVAHQFCEE
jgi:hypothetical protein